LFRFRSVALRRRRIPIRISCTAVLCLASPLSAQDTGRARISAGIHAIGLGTHATPALTGEAKTESYVTNPLFMVHGTAASGRLSLAGSLNFEKWTLRGGELAAGNAGEGYIDRRHPHTWLHELVATARLPLRGADFSLAAGRGFAPFGTDDPMVRPFAKFPANHHLMQIPERLLLIGAARFGPVGLEAGLFNGDEPTGPGSLGRPGRFADSWAARLTLRPAAALELAASHARVESPEHALGGGLDQRKWSASARWDGDQRPGRLYGLLEWGETYEYASGVRAYVFTTILAEGGVALRDWRTALRFERTTRPEEERLADPFRSARPHGDENIVGATRWNTVTLHAARAFSVRALGLEPFAEAARSRVSEITGAIFDPLEFYGSTSLWNLSLGIRIRAGVQHARMGRYGAALPDNAGHPAVHGMTHE
jgi:hypothetical protein